MDFNRLLPEFPLEDKINDKDLKNLPDENYTGGFTFFGYYPEKCKVIDPCNYNFRIQALIDDYKGKKFHLYEYNEINLGTECPVEK